MPVAEVAAEQQVSLTVTRWEVKSYRDCQRQASIFRALN